MKEECAVLCCAAISAGLVGTECQLFNDLILLLQCCDGFILGAVRMGSMIPVIHVCFRRAVWRALLPGPLQPSSFSCFVIGLCSGVFLSFLYSEFLAVELKKCDLLGQCDLWARPLF